MKTLRVMYLFGCTLLVLLACNKKFEIIPGKPVNDGVQVWQAGWGLHANGKYYTGCIADATFDTSSQSVLIITGVNEAGDLFNIRLNYDNSGLRPGNKYSSETGNADMSLETHGVHYATYLEKPCTFTFFITNFNDNIIEGEFVGTLVDSLTNSAFQITGGQVKAAINGGQQCGAVTITNQADTSNALLDSVNSPVIEGNYIQNVALDGSNTITLFVDVNKIGTYTISSPEINGIQFLASGVFLHKGLTAVKLTAVGMPVASGRTTFPISINKNVVYNAVITVVTNAVATAKYYPVTPATGCSSYTVHGDFTEEVALDANNTIRILVNVTQVGVYNFSTKTVNGIALSASGTFAQTGKQIMTIQCQGAPSKSGTTIIPFSMNNIICNFMINVLPD
jgi:hypothetical protein